MKQTIIKIAVISAISLSVNSCKSDSNATVLPTSIKIEGIAQNPEGIEFNKNDNTFLLSSLNASPVIKVNTDGTFKSFTSGEKFPLSTSGLQIDYKRNRLLVAGFNGTELMDNDDSTKGMSYLRIYNLETGVIEKSINLSSLAPEASRYFANDIAVDSDGNVYISDWYANLIYKVDTEGKATIFWKNNSGIEGTPNGLDFNPNGYLLVSLVNVGDKGLYENYGLIKIPVTNADLSTTVNISDVKFSGFDGMVLTPNGTIIGVTNNQKVAGGNTLLELSSSDNWKSAKVINSKDITTSTTVALTPDNKNYVINQNFADSLAKTWTIEQIKF